ncbi:hypothetical protein COLO4_05657 [Corchorus olitorius]|uniref:Uncharacterized protein n=1 Tax=Corchorus olitorius TaxID=93759 RepID=A0A1R3KQC3_9ROSI|nr:hypothetical protein COLO4_05657 [Corchorus olitorius]
MTAQSYGSSRPQTQHQRRRPQTNCGELLIEKRENVNRCEVENHCREGEIYGFQLEREGE